MKFHPRYLAAALAVTLASGAVLAESLPASKATFAYQGLIALPSSTYDLAAPSADSGWATVLKAQIKTANQKDLFINPSLQCGIVTDTTVKSLNGSLDTAEARGTIRVRVQITAPDGSTRYAEPNGTGATADPAERNTDGLVYCDRIQTLKAKFSGLNCDADLVTGEVTCADPEELQLILKTLNANSFNFVAADVASGVHTIEIQARTSANIGVDSQNGSLAGAEAFIGAGSATIEEVRMIQGNTGETLPLD